MFDVNAIIYELNEVNIQRKLLVCLSLRKTQKKNEEKNALNSFCDANLIRNFTIANDKIEIAQLFS